MSEPGFTFRIKLILTLALLAVVTAFSVTFLRGESRDRAAHEANERKLHEAEAKGIEVPF